MVQVKQRLLGLFLGYYHPSSGTVLVNGLNPIKERMNVLRNSSFVPQLPPPIKLNLDELISYIHVKVQKSERDPFFILRKKWSLT